MSKVNKYEDLIVNHYTNHYIEDERFVTKGKRLEYITTMHYIKKFAKKGCKILELGAGTGAYSVELAKMGYNVTAVELVESNLNVMKKKAEGIKNIVCLQGDALDLSRFEDNSFDIVLNLGPMYHLYNQKDQNRAIAETLRVCKQDGISIFAFIPHYSTIWYVGIKNNGMDQIKGYLTKNGDLKITPEHLFATYDIKELKNQFKNTNTTLLSMVSTDSIGPLLNDKFENVSDEDYEYFGKWHLKTCEKPEILGTACHILYICKKN